MSTGGRRRADLVLVERGLFESRARAQGAIRAGLVSADGRAITRASDVLDPGARIEARAEHPYVSRGGLKLAAALDAFGLDPAGRSCLDVGASTGGFTDVLLRRGARHVAAIDVGRDQLHASLRADPRVTSLEGTDIRNLAPDGFAEAPGLVTVDVSFIALRLVLPAIEALMEEGAGLVALIKPQFEAGCARVGRGGIVRDAAVHEAVCDEIRACLDGIGLGVLGLIPSPVEGGDGNREFLVGARKGFWLSEPESETVTIARLGARGDGLTAEGLVVPGALPGERVAMRRDGNRAVLVALETSSPERIAPFCPYYENCGGCAVQHLAPEPYAAWKRGIVVQALEQAGLATEIAPLVEAHGAGRRRITLHVREIEGRARAGLMAARSHDLTPIEHCPITVPPYAGAPAIAEALAEPLGRGRKPLDVVASATETGLDVDIRGHGPAGERVRAALTALAASLDLARLSLHGDIVVERRAPTLVVGAARLQPPPGGFLQATAAGEAVLSALVVGAMDRSTKRVADLFCGSGPFALALAATREVHAVEGEEAALRALDRAMRAAPTLRRVTQERRDLFRRPLLVPELDRFDAVVFDPPRAGAQAQVRWLAESKVPLVVGVACDPGTFARDAATLVSGGYRLERVTPIDQFAYSGHVEMVGVFRRPALRRGRR